MKVELRFLQQGLVRADAPVGFENWSDSRKEEWANNTLRYVKQEKGDSAILEALAELANPHETGKFFDEAPLVSAIEADNGDKTLFETSEWKEFKKPNQEKYLVFTSFNSGEHTNFIADGIKEVAELVYMAFDEEGFPAFEAELRDFLQNANELSVVGTNEFYEFHNGTWITVTLASK